MLHDRLAWWIAGPLLALCVVACRALFNARLGVTGGFSSLVTEARRGSWRFDWRGWFALGIVGGGLLYVVLWGGPAFEGYSWMTETFHGAGRLAIPGILLVSGVLIGYGAKVAGGCTSGNGLSGVSGLSRASLAATATFFSIAIVINLAIEAVT